MAVEDYKRSVDQAFGDLASNGFDLSVQHQDLLDPNERIAFDHLKSKFELILQQFILPEAALEINIPCELRQTLLQSCRNDRSYHPSLLAPACAAVVELLRISAFIPFATDSHRLQIWATTTHPNKNKDPLSINPSGSPSSSSSSSSSYSSSPFHRLRSNSLALLYSHEDTENDEHRKKKSKEQGAAVVGTTTTVTTKSVVSAAGQPRFFHMDQEPLSYAPAPPPPPPPLCSPCSPAPAPAPASSVSTTFFRKLTSSFRFRARSHSPPPRWRQIHIDPRALTQHASFTIHTTPTTETSLERGNSCSSSNSTNSSSTATHEEDPSYARPRFTLARSQSSTSTDFSGPSSSSASSSPHPLGHSFISFLPELPSMPTHFFHPFEIKSAHDTKKN
ncbi:hypothetical protein EC973_000164 [Apophysomyces ossiformis]|uniref:Uncharacterized protein n=1 Tax=Apophysomyces ossiformis TaxID=679940 RepID=A0A8H7C102_9FUNG|nr:hypothetical protein EC973_000164 [Apophysomyces ossiformis]